MDTINPIYLTRDEFVASGTALYGPHWRAKLAKRLGVEPSSVGRWASGAVRVPSTVSLAVTLLVKIQSEQNEQEAGSKRKHSRSTQPSSFH